MYASGPGVRVLDLRRRTPFADASFEVVYHSHVLEHLSRQQAVTFLEECFRILKRGGIIRVAVPDLEKIARLYIDSLEKARVGIPGAADNHEWMTMELLDQCVREQSGGELVRYFDRGTVHNREFIAERWGSFADAFLDRSLKKELPPKRKPDSPPEIAWRYVLHHPNAVLRNKILKLFMGSEALEQLNVGKFRRAGEVHMWMYDSYSLSTLLQQIGFEHPTRMSATESRIPNWTSFGLDTEPNGRVYKADSLYMEAVKP